VTTHFKPRLNVVEERIIIEVDILKPRVETDIIKPIIKIL
jgi:hypothetical protein